MGPSILRFVAKRSTKTWLAVAAIVALAGYLRFFQLGSLPHGLYPDEAANGLSALAIIAGARPIFLTDNFGREPLFAYLVAPAVAALGRTPAAIRIVSGLAGLGSVLGVFLAQRALFDTRSGLLASTLMATTIWPVMLSRLGTRPVLLPLLLSFALWQAVVAWRTNRVRHWVATGILIGLTGYTYTPVRLFGIVVVGFGLGLWWRHQERARMRLRGGLYALLTAALIISPLVSFLLANPHVIGVRAGQVSIFGHDQASSVVVLLRVLGDQLLRVGKMFLLEGDQNLRHNVAPLPVFAWPLALPLLAGLAVSLRQLKRPTWTLSVIWLVVMLLPTVLSDAAPHYLRAAGILPVLFAWPACGLAWLYRQLRVRVAGPWAITVSAGLLGLSILASVRALVLDNHLAQPKTSGYFAAVESDLAIEINRFLGTGWTGRQVFVPPYNPLPERKVWLGPELAHSTPLRYLVPQRSEDPDLPLETLAPDRPHPALARGTHLVLVKHPYVPLAFDLIPAGWVVELWDGGLSPVEPLEVSTAPYYRAYRVKPPESVRNTARLGCWEDGPVLRDMSAVPGEEQIVLTFVWSTPRAIEENLALYLYVRAGDAILAEYASSPTGGLWPTSDWRRGEVVVDRHTIALPEGWSAVPGDMRVQLNLFGPASPEPIAVTDCEGHRLQQGPVLQLP